MTLIFITQSYTIRRKSDNCLYLKMFSRSAYCFHYLLLRGWSSKIWLIQMSHKCKIKPRNLFLFFANPVVKNKNLWKPSFAYRFLNFWEYCLFYFWKKLQRQILNFCVEGAKSQNRILWSENFMIQYNEQMAIFGFLLRISVMIIYIPLKKNIFVLENFSVGFFHSFVKLLFFDKI